MRRTGLVMAVLWLALCLVACGDTPSVVGTWVQDVPQSYSFRLMENGHCVMLDGDGEWVSDGTYTADDDRVYFETDTGSFVWMRTEDGMLFRANGHELYYHLQK